MTSVLVPADLPLRAYRTQVPVPEGWLDSATLTARAPLTANKPANKPAEPTWAGQPFVGTILKGQSVVQNGQFTIPPQIPGLGGKSFKLPDGGGSAPGLVVYFPNVKTAFVTASQATIPVPAISKDTKLKWVATVSDKSVQYGLGNSLPVGGNAGNIFFWNVRADATGIARGAALSLRPENKGKEVVIGTLNAGLLHKPACPDGTTPSHLSDLAAGTGFQAQVVAKDGQIMVRHGTVLLPIAVWEASMIGLSTAATKMSDLACDGKTLMQRVGDVARNAVGGLGRLLSPEEIAKWGPAIGAAIWEAAKLMLQPQPSL